MSKKDGHITIKFSCDDLNDVKKAKCLISFNGKGKMFMLDSLPEELRMLAYQLEEKKVEEPKAEQPSIMDFLDDDDLKDDEHEVTTPEETEKLIKLELINKYEQMAG